MSARFPFGPTPIQWKHPETGTKQAIGIAYSGGGDRVVIHMGIVQAFIELGVVPDHVAGTSAGAYASVLHALDPNSTRLIPLAIRTAQKGIPALRPSLLHILFSVVPAGIAYLFGGIRAVHLQSIAHTGRVRKLLEKRLPVQRFGQLQLDTHISATDALTGQEKWFHEPDELLVPAMLASSAVPGLFPPVRIGNALYIDGGTSDNLPLLRLAELGCTVIFACDVGYAGETNKPPRNLLDTVLLAESIGQYADVLLQEELLAARYPHITVIPVRPRVALATLPTDFRTRDIPRYVEQSAKEARQILLAAGVTPSSR